MVKYKEYDIRKIPTLVAFIFFRMKGCVFMNKIYLRKPYYESLGTGIPNTKTLGYLEHEITHLESEHLKADKLAILYWLNPKIRLKEELKAAINEMKVYKSHKEKFDIQERAKSWSSVNYLWMTDYHTAKKMLEANWKSL